MEGGGFYVGAVRDLAAIKATALKVWYSGATCWWTTDPAHIYSDDSIRRPPPPSEPLPAPGGGGFPAGPRGEPLYETDDVAGFISAAEEAPDGYYGEYGLLAFLAAYHGNVVVSETDQRPTSFRSWDDYNRLLREAGERVGSQS